MSKIIIHNNTKMNDMRVIEYVKAAITANIDKKAVFRNGIIIYCTKKEDRRTFQVCSLKKEGTNE